MGGGAERRRREGPRVRSETFSRSHAVFLNGPNDLRSRMMEASQRLEFERASVFRDRLVELETLSRALASLRESLERLTFVYAVPGLDGRDRLYFLKGGRVLGDTPRCRGAKQIERARELAVQLLGPVPPPGSGDEMDEIRVVAGWFRTHPEELGRTLSPEAFLKDPRRWPSGEAPSTAAIPLSRGAG